MDTKLKIEITSFALSSLMFDNANSDGDQEGFLTGKIYTQEGKNITDNDEHGSTKTTVIRIISHMPTFEPCEFYDAAGSINPDLMSEVIGPFSKDVVGYFDFKREIPVRVGTRPTLRMSLLFRNLCAQSEKPLTLLVLRQNKINRATLGNTYCFYQLDSKDPNRLVKVAGEIPNLGDTSQRQYTQVPCPSEVNDSIQDFLKKVPLSPDDMPEVIAHHKLMKDIEKAAEEVAKEEASFQASEKKLHDILAATKIVTNSIEKLLMTNDAKVSEARSSQTSEARSSQTFESLSTECAECPEVFEITSDEDADPEIIEPATVAHTPKATEIPASPKVNSTATASPTVSPLVSKRTTRAGRGRGLRIPKQ